MVMKMNKKFTLILILSMLFVLSANAIENPLKKFPAPKFNTTVEKDGIEVGLNSRIVVYDEDLIDIEKYQNITTLILWDTEITDKSLERIVQLKGLKVLVLAGTYITDTAAKEIGSLHLLYRLDLSETAITDVTVKELKNIKTLRELDLSDTKVSSAGIEALKNLHLAFLDISGTDVDDSIVEILIAMQIDGELSMFCTNISETAYQKIRKTYRKNNLYTTIDWSSKEDCSKRKNLEKKIPGNF